MKAPPPTHLATPPRRRAAAAVEFAFVAPLLFLIILGVWELGRLIQVQQVMMASLRDSARLAAQATIVTQTGDYQLIRRDQLFDAARDALVANGLGNLAGATWEFAFLDGVSTREPFEGRKLERFRLRLTIPYDNIRWTSLSLLNPRSITVELTWQMLVDDPFTLNTTLPGWSAP